VFSYYFTIFILFKKKNFVLVPFLFYFFKKKKIPIKQKKSFRLILCAFLKKQNKTKQKIITKF